ncbi:Cas10/Cmr2 second palm domain-containing protein [Ornithinimicrobium kibberense]|uniref:Cas10/Cmr2 second palm domain-containing protein n=1 Tax=Ornithinimicrobium kibberense TaxID=282060 RepID=A0ABV5V6J6_9MICO
MLSQATDEELWTEFLDTSSGWEWNVEAGNVSGIVSLRAADPTVPAARQAETTLRVLRASLPAAALTATWSSGQPATYAEFRRARPEGWLQSFPPGLENPAARPCRQCRRSTAVPRGASSSAPPTAEAERCQDCGLREQHAAYRARERAWSLRRLWDELRAQHPHVHLNVPDDLSALAALGARSTGRRRHPEDAATRVALICADGNAVGAFVAAATQRVNKGKVTRAIESATTTAVLNATSRHCLLHGASGQVADVALIPHVIGGDDLIASVSAHAVWDFVVTLCSEFDRALAATWSPQESRSLEGLTVPTLSVGVAIHHAKRPLGDAIREASDGLDDAKQQGMNSWIAWRDSVRGQPDSGHPAPRPATWLRAHLETIRTFASVPRAHRSTVMMHAAANHEAAEAWELVSEVTRRQGTRHLVERLVGSSTTPEGHLEDVQWALQVAADLDPHPGGRSSQEDSR